MPSRNEVYAAVDSEREYQEYVVDPSLSEQESFDKHSLPGELVLMKLYLDRATNLWAGRPTNETALDCVRKIAGIAVRCMEHHGAPPRMVPREAGSSTDPLWEAATFGVRRMSNE